MNIFLLFLLMLLSVIISFKVFKSNLLSPSFLSSGMFLIFSLAYIVFIDVIGRDISTNCLLLIFTSQIFVFFGEWFAHVIFALTTGKKRIISCNCVTNRRKIKKLRLVVSKKITVLFTILILLVAFLRFYKLYIYATSNYSISSIFDTVSIVRTDYALGKVTLGTTLAALYYCSLIVAYIYSFLFIVKLVFSNKKEFILLLPVLAYCLCVVTTTSRSEYIKLLCAFVTSYIICKNMCVNNKIKWWKVGIYAVVFVALFLVYGFSIRGINYNGFDSIISNIVSYSCASFYGVDEYLASPWHKNEVFGMYTLDNIYGLFGKNYVTQYEPTYFMQGSKSNIYTSIIKPLHDFGFIGLLTSRFILTFVAVTIQELMFRTNIKKKVFYFLLIFEIHNVYIFLMMPIGDKAYLFYLNPKYIAELLFGLIICLSFIKFKVRIDRCDITNNLGINNGNISIDKMNKVNVYKKKDKVYY